MPFADIGLRDNGVGAFDVALSSAAPAVVADYEAILPGNQFQETKAVAVN